MFRMIKRWLRGRRSATLNESQLTTTRQQQITKRIQSQFRKLVQGELDWIVMKALEKDRNRRYETAVGFGMDVQRYLAKNLCWLPLPVLGTSIKKFISRNRRMFSVVVTAMLVLLALTIYSVWQAYRATRAEELALLESQRRSRT